jgi:hypothetical protein
MIFADNTAIGKILLEIRNWKLGKGIRGNKE